MEAGTGRVGVLGAGRLGSALARALRESGVEMAGVGSRSPAAASRLADAVGVAVLGGGGLLRACDIVFLTVGDDVVAPLAATLATEVGAPPGDAAPARRNAGTARRAAVVHCSGALRLDVLGPLAAAGHAVGCWHPLQTFPTAATRLRAGVTAAVTAAEPLASALVELGERLGTRPIRLPDEVKTRYHAAAALASNYTVTLAAHAAGLLEDCGLDAQESLAALLPLLRSTVDGLQEEGLPEALTGPLARADEGTIRRHLDELADRPATVGLYRAAGLATLPLLAARGHPAPTLARLRDALGAGPGAPGTVGGGD